MRRPTVVAGPHRFYPGTDVSCRDMVEKLLRPPPGSPAEPKHPVGGIVPHAGWLYSGRTALAVLANLKRKSEPRTFVLFGFSHMRSVEKAAFYPAGAWESPLGEALVDEPLAAFLLDGLGEEAHADPRSHEGEHSIEVQIPLVQYFWPEAKIVPILVPSGRPASRVGERIGELVARSGRTDVFGLGTTDLTHYGPSYGFVPKGIGREALDWVRRENDKSMIQAILGMRAEDIEGEARSRRNACGPGAVAATIGYARARGAVKGILIDYSTSHDAMTGQDPSTFVGYAGILF